MINCEFMLPFEIERACRCSFVVHLNNGERAFISNDNLLYLMQNPNARYEIVDRLDRSGSAQHWIMVAKVVWTFGFKKCSFGPDGNPIR